MSAAPTRAQQWVVTPGAEQPQLYAGSYALLVGVSDYNNGWPKLKGVPGDIAAVDEALKKVGFETEIEMDPGAGALEAKIKSFIGRRGAGLNNRLLIYYAGHGHTQKTGYGSEIGYIVPRDAPDPSKDPAGFKTAALSMQSIEVFARQIDAKHALFVFDSCFSGSIFHPTRAIPEFVQEKSARPVRQFITSGAADQPVPDQSIFRREFVSAILGEAGIGKDGYVSGSQLGAYLEEKVTNYSRRTQTPQYGKIQDPNLDRGDFIFTLPKPATPAPTAAAPTPPPTPTPAPTATQATGASGPSNDAEILFWQSIATSTNPADFQEYLKQFPNGRFAGLAKIRATPAPKAVASAASPAPTPAPTAAPAAAAPAPAQAPSPTPSATRQQQAAVPAPSKADVALSPDELAARLSGASRAISNDAAKRYAQAENNKAIAVAWNSNSWRVTGLASAAGAELRALEGCQLSYATPCGLAARNNEVFVSAGAALPLQDMPRLRYSGPFDIQKIPTIGDQTRASPAVAGYAAAGGPKAMALNPSGRVHVSTASASATQAQEDALRACNTDPGRGQFDGPCYVYAVMNDVILPQRLTAPVGDPYSLITAAGLRVQESAYAPRYAAAENHKAIALNVEKGRVYYMSGMTLQERASAVALESCQIMYGTPCVLLAAGSQLLAPDPAAAPRRDSERAKYRGPFKLDRAPFRLLSSDAVKTYENMADPKAMAIAPDVSRAFVVTGAASLAEAERRALADCEAAAARELPCLLYAVSNQVVLPDRRVALR